MSALREAQAVEIISELSQTCPVVPREGHDYCPLCKTRCAGRPFVHRVSCVYTRSIEWLARQ